MLAAVLVLAANVALILAVIRPLDRIAVALGGVGLGVAGGLIASVVAPHEIVAQDVTVTFVGVEIALTIAFLFAIRYPSLAEHARRAGTSVDEARRLDADRAAFFTGLVLAGVGAAALGVVSAWHGTWDAWDGLSPSALILGYLAAHAFCLVVLLVVLSLIPPPDQVPVGRSIAPRPVPGVRFGWKALLGIVALGGVLGLVEPVLGIVAVVPLLLLTPWRPPPDPRAGAVARLVRRRVLEQPFSAGATLTVLAPLGVAAAVVLSFGDPAMPSGDTAQRGVLASLAAVAATTFVPFAALPPERAGFALIGVVGIAEMLVGVAWARWEIVQEALERPPSRSGRA